LSSLGVLLGLRASTKQVVIFRLFLIGLALTLAQPGPAQAEISFEWVTIGDPGNPNDPLTGISTGDQPPPARGAVSYVYSISKYETTIGQYTAFLNAVAKSDLHGLYHEAWGTRDAIRGITRVGTPGNYVYHVRNAAPLFSDGLTSANRPVSGVTYLDAVRFVNWLHNGQGNGDTETGAYTISEGQATRSPDARFWIPIENEWYKAAYYDPSPTGPADDYWRYPWRSDQPSGPIPANYYYNVTLNSGIPSPTRFREYITYLMDVRSFGEATSYYGTLNQAGNVEEWTEGDAYSEGPYFRGGHWNTAGHLEALPLLASFSYPQFSNAGSEPGFRVATVANPPAGGLSNGDKIRFHPRAGHGARMVGGVFEGSADGSLYETLHTVTEIPADGWREVTVNFDQARYFRYRSPDGGHGNVAEIEFYRSGAKVASAASGTPGSWNNQGSSFEKALDGNLETFFDAQEPNGAFVQVDTGSTTPFGIPAGYDHLDVITANGSGNYRPDQRVGVYFLIGLEPPGHYFAGGRASRAFSTIPLPRVRRRPSPDGALACGSNRSLDHYLREVSPSKLLMVAGMVSTLPGPRSRSALSLLRQASSSRAGWVTFPFCPILF
jgi:formylglycine-generating enzyme required for sulfatase activity